MLIINDGRSGEQEFWATSGRSEGWNFAIIKLNTNNLDKYFR